MQNRDRWKKLGDFMLGKGFYIVLFLCVATIGISGYYLIRTVLPLGGETQSTGGDALVVLPETEAEAPDLDASLPEFPTLADEDDPLSQETAAPQTAAVSPPKTEVAAETAPAPEPVVYTWPVKGAILRDYSVETLSLDPTLADWRTHGGLDISSQGGTQVLAMRSGTVSAVYEDGLMGITVVIDHGDGLTSTYCNLADRPTVQAGDKVQTGTVIGAVGDSAIAERGVSDHLHLETAMAGQSVDPREFLPEL